MATRRQKMQELRRLTRVAMAAYVQEIKNKSFVIGDLEKIINDAEALHNELALHGGDLSDTTSAIRDAIAAGGLLEGKFNTSSEAATQFLLQLSSQLVTNINEQQREAIQIITAAGRTLGENPRTIALDLVGRVSRSGVREGGVIGLNAQQAQASANAIYALRSGDPTLMHEYLKYKRRDRRFDATVRRYAAMGKPVPSHMAHTISARYQARLLQTRAETIARTEVMEALEGGAHVSIREQMERGLIEPMAKVWQSTHDGRERDSHAEMDGVAVPFDEPFMLPDGSRVMHPCDSSLGAAAAEIINCRCTVRHVPLSEVQIDNS